MFQIIPRFLQRASTAPGIMTWVWAVNSPFSITFVVRKGYVLLSRGAKLMKIRSKVESIHTDVITLNWKFREKQELNGRKETVYSVVYWTITKGQGYIYVTGKNRS
jgi:hypothetical protein